MVASVTDEGIGIAPDQLDHIFQPFSRFDSETKEAETSGSTLLEEIVEGHHGSIRVESPAAPAGAGVVSNAGHALPRAVPFAATPVDFGSVETAALPSGGRRLNARPEQVNRRVNPTEDDLRTEDCHGLKERWRDRRPVMATRSDPKS